MVGALRSSRLRILGVYTGCECFELLLRGYPGLMISVGWITVIAWICSCAGAFSFMSNTLSGLIIFNSPDYEPKAWHSTVFLIAFLLVPLVLNLYLRKIINYLETIGGIFHVILFVAIVATLCTLAKRSTPEYVFLTLHTDAGWTNPGIAFSIGMLGRPSGGTMNFTWLIECAT